MPLFCCSEGIHRADGPGAQRVAEAALSIVEKRIKGALAQKGAPLPKMLKLPAGRVTPGAAGKPVDEQG
jgi:hypothetical protein